MSALLRNLRYPFLSTTVRSTQNSLYQVSSQVRCMSSESENVKLKAQTEMQNYWQQNMSGKRPWSPHLTIYKMELPMLTSLLHRGSGIAMAIAWGGIGVGAFWYTGHYEPLMNWVANMHMAAPILFGAKFIMSWPLIYHYVNGMRHLAYDFALGFEIKTTMTTGYMGIVISLLLAALVSSITLSK